MRPLRYSINVTLDGCCDHRRPACLPTKNCIATRSDNLNRADALLFGRVTYEMMESAFGTPAADIEALPGLDSGGTRSRGTIDAAPKYVVSSTLPSGVDWNADLLRGDLASAVQRLKAGARQGIVRRRRHPPARPR